MSNAGDEGPEGRGDITLAAMVKEVRRVAVGRADGCWDSTVSESSSDCCAPSSSTRSYLTQRAAENRCRREFPGGDASSNRRDTFRRSRALEVRKAIGAWERAARPDRKSCRRSWPAARRGGAFPIPRCLGTHVLYLLAPGGQRRDDARGACRLLTRGASFERGNHDEEGNRPCEASGAGAHR